MIGTILISSCKPGSVNFKYNSQVNMDFFGNITQIAGHPDWIIDSINVFQCVLQEKLVERNGVPDYKLINTKSKQPSVDFVISRNYHRLFIFQLFTSPMQDDLCVFMATSFTPDSMCTGLGPAYFGNTRIYEMDIKRQLKIIEKNNQYQLLDKNKINMNFYIDSTLDLLDPGLDTFPLQQIILQDANRVAGKKPVIFNAEKIFNDPDALVFTWFQTIRKNK